MFRAHFSARMKAISWPSRDQAGEWPFGISWCASVPSASTVQIEPLWT